MVEAILAGQEAGLAAAYDRYAASLYDYCHSLLAEPADAASEDAGTVEGAGGTGQGETPVRRKPKGRQAGSGVEPYGFNREKRR